MWRYVWSAIVFGAAMPVMAEEGRLTESEFLAPLTEGHPAIVALTERLARAEGELRAATVLNPELGFDREAPDGATSQSVYWLSWQPPVDGRRGLRKRAAEAGMRAAASDFDWSKLQLRVALRAAYAQWALSIERRDILSEHVAKIRRLAERARVRSDTGSHGLSCNRPGSVSSNPTISLVVSSVMTVWKYQVFSP